MSDHREALAEIAASEAVNQQDFDAICDDYPRLLAELASVRARADVAEQERDEALRQAAQDRAQCDEMTADAASARAQLEQLREATLALDEGLTALIGTPEYPGSLTNAHTALRLAGWSADSALAAVPTARTPEDA